MNDTRDKKKKSEAHGESQRLEEETMPEDLIDFEDDESPIEDIKDDINLKVKLDEANDRILRMAAEMENSRKRGLKEKEDAIKYSTTKFARDIVTVADDLERAIESIKDINLDDNEATKTLYEGIELTMRSLTQIFERNGIERFDPTGEKFDPTMHEAMFLSLIHI